MAVTLSLIDIAEILDHVITFKLIESLCFTPKQTVVYIWDDILKIGLKLVWFPNSSHSFCVRIQWNSSF